MKKTTLLLLCFLSMLANAQEKKIWAKSFINKKAPEFIVEKWISEEPNMTEGKFILIDFWATWCGPCKRAIPKLNKFQQEFRDDLIIIGISDEPKSIVKAQINPTIEYFSAIDTKKRLKNIYEVTGIPHCIIINPAGIVVWEGFPDLTGNELTSEVIKNLINKPNLNDDKLTSEENKELTNTIDYSSVSITELNAKKTELELDANYILVNDYLEQIERGDIDHMALTKIDNGIIKPYWESAAELKPYYNKWREESSKIANFNKKNAPELTELSSQFNNKKIERQQYLQMHRAIISQLKANYPNEYPQLVENHIQSLKTMWKVTGRYMLEDYKKQGKTFPIYWIPESTREISENKKKYKVINQELMVVKNEIKKKA